MFIVRLVARRLVAWLRGRNPLVSRAFVLASIVGWLWRRRAGGRVLTLDPREGYAIEVGPAGRFEDPRPGRRGRP